MNGETQEDNRKLKKPGTDPCELQSCRKSVEWSRKAHSSLVIRHSSLLIVEVGGSRGRIPGDSRGDWVGGILKRPKSERATGRYNGAFHSSCLASQVPRFLPAKKTLNS